VGLEDGLGFLVGWSGKEEGGDEDGDGDGKWLEDVMLLEYIRKI
jgi:hypothetical protein